jgi:FtsZ-interacting cell division protein ZipA
MTLAVVAGALLIVGVIIAIIVNVVKSGAERTQSQLASANPAPTTEITTEPVELPGISDVAEATSTEEPTTEVVEEPTEEVTEATEEETEEPTEEETTEEEAQPTEGAQPTVAQPTQQAQQPTQQQPTQPTQQPSGGSSSWSYQYHNDNGVVTVSTSGDFPAGVDPNNPASVQQWIESQTGVDYSYFFQ